MIRLLYFLLIAFLVLLATACGVAAPAATSTAPPTSPPPSPTPLPTAVPPAGTPGSWAVGFTHTFPPGSWSPGGHRYGFRLQCSAIDYDLASEWRLFTVSEQAAPQPIPIYLRLHGLSLERFSPAYASDATIHPEQETIAALWLLGLSEEEASQAVSGCEAIVGWDEGRTQVLTAEEPFQP